jgi:uncharacterized protein YegJ (DUF2314 family)
MTLGGDKMAVKKEKSPVNKKKQAASKADKAFALALLNLEALARERIDSARDSFAVGLRVADQIRELAERIEDEVRTESLAMTEASYSADVVGVTIGVL